MGRNATGERKYTLQTMWDIHHEIKRRLLLGQKQVDIAEQLGVTEPMVSYTKNSPIVQRELSYMQAARDTNCVDIAKQIKEYEPQAVKLLGDVMNNPNHPVHLRVKVAMDILDRGGHAAPTRVTGEILHGHFTAADIDDIKERARLAREKAAGRDVMPAELVEVVDNSPM